MNAPLNSDTPDFHVEVDGGQGVQAGSGNQQFNQYITVQISSPAASTTAGKTGEVGEEESGASDSAAITTVPRSREQLTRVVASRPRAWEYLLFAGAMSVEMEELDARYRDYLIGYAPRSGNPIYEANFIEFYNFQLSELLSIADLFQSIYSNRVVDEAIGPPGVSGDPVRILHLAKRYISVYDELLRWTERLRGTPVPEKYQRLISILSRYSEQPIAEIRRFVHDYAEQVALIPAALNSGKSVRLTLRVKFDLASDLSEGTRKEFDRLKAELAE